MAKKTNTPLSDLENHIRTETSDLTNEALKEYIHTEVEAARATAGEMQASYKQFHLDMIGYAQQVSGAKNDKNKEELAHLRTIIDERRNAARGDYEGLGEGARKVAGRDKDYHTPAEHIETLEIYSKILTERRTSAKSETEKEQLKNALKATQGTLVTLHGTIDTYKKEAKKPIKYFEEIAKSTPVEKQAQREGEGQGEAQELRQSSAQSGEIDVITSQKVFEALEQLESKLDAARAEAFERFAKAQFEAEKATNSSLTDEALYKEQNRERLHAAAEKDYDYRTTVATHEKELYQEVGRALENAPKIKWDPKPKNEPNAQVFTDEQGKKICTITSTKVVDEPKHQVQINGQDVVIAERRELQLPRTLEPEQGPRHMAFTLKDTRGQNMPQRDSLYFTAHYDEGGKLTGCTYPKPIKFKENIAYIEHNGNVFTLPVNKQELEGLQKEIAKNRGTEVAQDLVSERSTESPARDTVALAQPGPTPEIETKAAPEPAQPAREDLLRQTEPTVSAPEVPSRATAPQPSTTSRETQEPSGLRPAEPANLRPAVAAITTVARAHMDPAVRQSAEAARTALTTASQNIPAGQSAARARGHDQEKQQATSR